MADIIELRGPGNNGNELITVARDGRGNVTVQRDGVPSDVAGLRAILADAQIAAPPTVDEPGARSDRFRVRGEVLDLFASGAPVGDFGTGEVAEVPVEEVIVDDR